jgi:hypothetical protein
MASGEARELPTKGPAPRLMSENLRTWDVLLEAFRRRMFTFVALAGVVGFDYVAVMKVIELLVPPGRHLEVFTKFGWVEQYAINAVTTKKKRAGGRDGQGNDAAAGGKGRRQRRS